MVLKVGDKVKFLDDIGGGVITRINQQTIYVKSSDGFEIPSFESDLIKINTEGFGDLMPEPQTKQTNPQTYAPIIDPDEFEDQFEEGLEEETITSENCTLNILMGIVPVTKKGSSISEFQIHMINDCTYRVLYSFSVVKENFCYGRKSGMIEEDTKVYTTSFTLDELKEIHSFKIGCIFYKMGIFLPHEPIIYDYKIDIIALSDLHNWKENDYFDEKAIIINITEESLIYEIERTVTESEEKFIIRRQRKESKIKTREIKPISDIEEVDLHIDQLVDDSKNLSNGEIVDIQMSRFNIALEGAIKNKVKKIVFIHGVGNGKLKHEIRKVLDTGKYSHLKYQDASFKEYGYGATLVILK